MCGISGFYSKNLSSYNNVILKMNRAISHRGPDGSSTWKDTNFGIFFGHQRLSIIDLSAAGNQPMISSSGRYVITYNGEVYNHINIRKELEQKNSNIKWKSHTDTETLLEAFEVWGVEKTLNKIESMFAFVIWDKKLRILTLARDRMGEKPLYFGWQGDKDNKVFLFGSEIKALKVHPVFRGEINRDAVALQLRHNCVPAPFSIFKDIYKLLPGHYLQLKEDDLKKNLLPNSKAYWSLADKAVVGNNNQLILNDGNIQQNLENLLKKSVKQQMLSDVPLGAFLSGGIDSSVIVSMMQSQSIKPVKTFTIGFSENNYNEAIYAKDVAKHLGTDHTELYVSPKQAMDIIPKIPSIYDEPFSDSSQIPTFLVSQLARQNVKVALSGDGGDELFCGYNRYQLINKRSKILSSFPLFFRKLLSNRIKSISQNKWNQIFKMIPGVNKYANFAYKMHKGANAIEAKNLESLYYVLCSDWQNPTDVVIDSKETKKQFSFLDYNLKQLRGYQKMMAIDAINYLPNDILVKIDRAAMSSSLETRTPFLNHKLIEYVWKIPHSLKLRNGDGKWILKQILNQYVPKNLVDRPKMGFGIPLASWLRGPLRDWVENLINEKKLLKAGFLNSKLVRQKWELHLSNKKNTHYELWNILMFLAWMEDNNQIN